MTETRPPTILVVDDHEAGRYAVARVLVAAGFEVVEAATGADALRLARDLPDLVLLDVNLPDMSGFDVCARIKADAATAHVPVVHLSATYVGGDHVAEGLEGGADAYLTQPVDPRQLVATVNAVLRLFAAELELRRQGALLSALVQSSSDAIYVKDLQGRYQFFNAAAEAVTGKAASDVLGHDDTLLFPPGEAAEVMARDGRVIRERRVMTFDERVTTASGEIRTFLSTKGPLLAADGEPYGMYGVARDITERKRAEEEVQRLNAELEARVVARTDELEDANRELEAFAYSVSHDLRAPLRAIDGFAAILQQDNAAQLDDAGRESLARIRAAAGRMSVLIDDLLMLSRMSRADLRVEQVDVSAMAREVAAELAAAEPDRLIELVVADGLQTRADPHLLRVVLVNLLSNAVKFTSRHRSARIEVGCEQTVCGPTFFVRDDGAGFDMAYADKLFGAFQRLHGPQEFPGTGIGLATVQHIVHRHHGRVWAESRVEGGATFHFTLGGGNGAGGIDAVGDGMP